MTYEVAVTESQAGDLLPGRRARAVRRRQHGDALEVQHIAEASRQQVEGLETVSSAMQQMDQVTQANAATSEESASAAEELRRLVNRMERLINGQSRAGGDAAAADSFRVDAGAAPSRSRQRRAGNNPDGQGSVPRRQPDTLEV